MPGLSIVTGHAICLETLGSPPRRDEIQLANLPRSRRPMRRNSLAASKSENVPFPICRCRFSAVGGSPGRKTRLTIEHAEKPSVSSVYGTYIGITSGRAGIRPTPLPYMGISIVDAAGRSILGGDALRFDLGNAGCCVEPRWTNCGNRPRSAGWPTSCGTTWSR